MSGKVGNVVGASWKGIDYLRALPSQVANPRTEAQMTSRTKMSLVVKFLRSCTALVRIGFKGFAVKMSAFNAAASYNLQQAITGVYPALEIDYPQVLVSRGTLAEASSPSATSAVAGVIDFSWQNVLSALNSSDNDEAMLLAYNPAKGTSVYKLAAAARIDESATLEVPADWSGDTVECYIAFVDLTKMTGSQPKDYTSNSVHAGSIVAA